MTDKIKFIPSGEEPCATLVDGKYAVADVGVILTCHNHVHTYEKCPPGQIYVPGKDKCTPLKHVIKGKDWRIFAQLVFTCSKSTLETPEHCEIYSQS